MRETLDQFDTASPGGEVVASGLVDGVDERWTAGIAIDGPFGAAPVVLTQCQTLHGADPVVTRQRFRDGGRLDVRLQEGPSGGNHTREVMGWVAVGARPT